MSIRGHEHLLFRGFAMLNVTELHRYTDLALAKPTMVSLFKLLGLLLVCFISLLAGRCIVKRRSKGSVVKGS